MNRSDSGLQAFKHNRMCVVQKYARMHGFHLSSCAAWSLLIIVRQHSCNFQVQCNQQPLVFFNSVRRIKTDQDCLRNQ